MDRDPDVRLGWIGTEVYGNRPNRTGWDGIGWGVIRDS
jgi:hypothetical protein